MELKKISPLTQKVFWHILQLSVVCCGVYTAVWMKLLQSFCFSPHCLCLVPAVYTSCVSIHRLQTDSKDVQETCVKLFINFEVCMLHGSGINNMQQSKNTKSTLIAQQGSLLADFTQSLISRIMSRIDIFLIKDQAGQFNYQLFLP